MPVWLTDDEYRVLSAACDRLIPPSAPLPGAADAGVPDYIDRLLGAFSFDPPRIWAGGPTSGRHGGSADFEMFHRLSAIDELAWRMRIEGSQGRPERGSTVRWWDFSSGIGRVWPPWVPTSPPSVIRSRMTASMPSRSSSSFSTATPARECTGHRSMGVTATWSDGRPSDLPVTSSLEAGPMPR